MTDVRYKYSRIDNSSNEHQHSARYPRTLCVCSGGLLRSPSLAWFLSNEPYNRNTRAAGSHPPYSLVLVDKILLAWADEIVFLNRENFVEVEANHTIPKRAKSFILNIPDHFAYRDPGLIKLFPKELERVGFNNK